MGRDNGNVAIIYRDGSKKIISLDEYLKQVSNEEENRKIKSVEYIHQQGEDSDKKKQQKKGIFSTIFGVKANASASCNNGVCQIPQSSTNFGTDSVPMDPIRDVDFGFGVKESNIDRIKIVDPYGKSFFDDCKLCKTAFDISLRSMGSIIGETILNFKEHKKKGKEIIDSKEKVKRKLVFHFSKHLIGSILQFFLISIIIQFITKAVYDTLKKLFEEILPTNLFSYFPSLSILMIGIQIITSYFIEAKKNNSNFILKIFVILKSILKTVFIIQMNTHLKLYFISFENYVELFSCFFVSLISTIIVGIIDKIISFSIEKLRSKIKTQ